MLPSQLKWFHGCEQPQGTVCNTHHGTYASITPFDLTTTQTESPLEDCLVAPVKDPPDPLTQGLSEEMGNLTPHPHAV